MSVELCFGYGEPDAAGFPLATNTGWSDLCDWALALDDATYPDLGHLCKFGWATGLDVVAAQARHALKDSPPTVEGVASTVAHLAELLDAADPDDTAVVDH